jgi:hypothetical protein
MLFNRDTPISAMTMSGWNCHAATRRAWASEDCSDDLKLRFQKLSEAVPFQYLSTALTDPLTRGTMVTKNDFNVAREMYRRAANVRKPCKHHGQSK